MTNSEWAAWVQAVGSVVAILIAVAVPYWQTRTAREDSKAKNEKRRQGLLTMILPDLIKVHGWVKTGRRIFVEIEQHKTELVHTIQRVHCDPDPPVMLDRFADRLLLLGDDLSHRTVMVLSMARNMMQLAPNTFGRNITLQVNMADETGREVVAFYKKQFEALDRILNDLVGTLAKDHPNYMPPMSMSQSRAAALQERL